MSKHNKIIGPSLPPNWKTITTNDSEESEDNEVFGPSLPPSFSSDQQKQSTSSREDRVIGPTLPKVLKQRPVVATDSDDDSDDMIGPILPTHDNYHKYNEKFGNVSEALAKRMAEREVRQEREEWMTEPPKQLVSKIPTKSVKHFSQRPVKSNRSCDKSEKRDEKRDKELNEFMDSYNKGKKRDVSLIDIHSNTKKVKKDKEKAVEERVPFDREKDLTVRHMSATQTRSVLNKAKEFNDRFSKGLNKFL